MRLRITIKNHDDPSKDLEVAGHLRHDLWAHSPVEIDTDDPATRTRRTKDTRTAYFEFETDYPDEVERVIREYNYAGLVDVKRMPADCQASGT